ncbi:MAG: SMP-30/gluconolactonase/LRE family protein [Microbacteriaceae bacterium]|jgi:sugar lactone lactonase YvrE|nr:SMP-30/gluconolactonase/LRE family protein [Microbacteriaceae bacterium]
MGLNVTRSAMPVIASTTRSLLGESPRWDSDRQSLWWVDISGSSLHELRIDGSETTYSLDHNAGAVNLCANGSLLLATTVGLELLDPQTMATTIVASIESDAPDRRMNDAAIDSSGRVFAGTMRWDAGAPPHDGVLYRYDDGDATPVLTNLGCPNGMAWPRRDLLAFIDSIARRIDLWTVDPTTGDLVVSRDAIDLSRFDGIPDGMTIDSEGALWVAFWGGAAVRRLSLDGAVLSTVELPTPLVSSVGFGGIDLSTLYITTAVQAGEPVGDDGAGFLYRCTPGQIGVAPYRWGGAGSV